MTHSVSACALVTRLLAAVAVAVVVGCSAPVEASDESERPAAEAFTAAASDEATKAEASLRPYFRPAILVSARTNYFEPNKRTRDVGYTSKVTCQLERTYGWANERRIERGTRFAIPDITIISGPVATLWSKKVGLRGFLDLTDDKGRSVRSAQMALVCFGLEDGYTPTMTDLTEAFLTRGGPVGLAFELQPSRVP